jgi:hypothetical protein
VHVPRGDDTQLTFYLDAPPDRSKFPVIFFLQGSKARTVYDKCLDRRSF